VSEDIRLADSLRPRALRSARYPASLWNGWSAQLSSGCRPSLCSPRLKRRKRDHLRISLGQSAAQSRTRNRSRDCTGAVVSTIMRFRRAMRPVVRLRTTQSLRLPVSTTSARRRQPRPRKKEGAGCFTELQYPANKA